MEKYKDKKLKNQVLARFIRKFLSESSWEYVQDCNTFMMMVADETLENKKQHKGNTCKNRFCPICSWKKARKDALALAIQMEYIKDTYQKDFIFLTLTAPNVKAEELHDEIKEYNHAFQKLVKRKEVQNVVKGYIRKLEVTYNQDRDDYNPHFHVLIAVNKSYFNDRKQYITQARWLELWQQVTKNPLITNVHVQKVRTNSKKEVAELAKYSAKDSDYLANEKVFDAFYKGLKGKQLMVYSGLFKESNKLFKDGELDHYKEQDPTEYIYALLYHWGKGNYVEDEKRLLTDDEKNEVNGHFMEDMEEEKIDINDFYKSNPPTSKPVKTHLTSDEVEKIKRGMNQAASFDPNKAVKAFNNIQKLNSQKINNAFNLASFNKTFDAVNIQKTMNNIVKNYDPNKLSKAINSYIASNNESLKNLNVTLSSKDFQEVFNKIKEFNSKQFDISSYYKRLDLSNFELALENLDSDDNPYLRNFVDEAVNAEKNSEVELKNEKYRYQHEVFDSPVFNFMENINEILFDKTLLRHLIVPLLIVFQFYEMDLLENPMVGYAIGQATTYFTDHYLSSSTSNEKDEETE